MSQHPYMYCKGNPLKYSDPTGYQDSSADINADEKNWRDIGVTTEERVEIDTYHLQTLADIALIVTLVAIDGPLPYGDMAGAGVAYRAAMRPFPRLTQRVPRVPTTSPSLCFSGRNTRGGYDLPDYGSLSNRAQQQMRKAAKQKIPNNVAKNKEFDAVVKKLDLTDDQARKLHDHITGKGLKGYKEILQRARDLFN